MLQFAIIDAPSILGLRPTGVEHLPEALRAAGLLSHLRAEYAGRISSLPYNPNGVKVKVKDLATPLRGIMSCGDQFQPTRNTCTQVPTSTNKHKVLSHNAEETYVNKSKDSLTEELADLLNETAEAHHKAFASTNGVDDDWPIWYADYLLEKMRIMLNSKFTKSELIYILVSAEKENGLVAPGAYWPRFYANFIVNRYK